MTVDHNDTDQKPDPEESLWKLHRALGGPERANKEVRKGRARVMVVCIVLAVVTAVVAGMVESAGGPRWFSGILGSVAAMLVMVAIISVWRTFESPARIHDPRVQRYREWLELDLIERERQELQMSAEERTELKVAEQAYYDSGAGGYSTKILGD